MCGRGNSWVINNIGGLMWWVSVVYVNCILPGTGGLGVVYCIVVWGCGAVRCSKSGLESGKFYGMELPRVGAFTENRGSGYRKPVQISGENRENHLKSGN